MRLQTLIAQIILATQRTAGTDLFNDDAESNPGAGWGASCQQLVDNVFTQASDGVTDLLGVRGPESVDPNGARNGTRATPAAPVARPPSSVRASCSRCATWPSASGEHPLPARRVAQAGRAGARDARAITRRRRACRRRSHAAGVVPRRSVPTTQLGIDRAERAVTSARPAVLGRVPSSRARAGSRRECGDAAARRSGFGARPHACSARAVRARG